MLWALLFSLILNNDPAFIIPKLEKEVRQNVNDKQRTKEILELRKSSEKDRKDHGKERKKTFKEFDKLNTSRETTHVEFNHLMKVVKKQRNELQHKDIERFLQVKVLITQDEWTQMLPNITKYLSKHEKQKSKELKVLNKQYEKLTKRIRRVVKDKERQTQIIANSETIFSSTVLYINCYYKYIEDINSVIYNYSSTEDDLQMMIKEVNAANDIVLESSVTNHFSTKKLTTNKEWKRIVKHIVKL